MKSDHIQEQLLSVFQQAFPSVDPERVEIAANAASHILSGSPFLFAGHSNRGVSTASGSPEIALLPGLLWRLKETVQAAMKDVAVTDRLRSDDE